ncbi:hypothetical protein [Aquimarina sp. 2201CG5-10]|uniref:hypothetical protein n=1 Tax=Aquimarina callyspongiae TaxID=3098150 RepID=UPI002AC8DBD8|nr:hypothetical protein [Aquimarina sp. 2201CG5-10]
MEGLKNTLPDLHSAGVSDKELFKTKPEDLSLEEANNLEEGLRIKKFKEGYKRIEKSSWPVVTNFNDYKFRAHSIGHIMSGIPKPLTTNQEEEYNVLLLRHKGEGKALTLKQIEKLGDYSKRKNRKPFLTDGAKTYLEKLVFQEITGRKKDITAKYLDKGIQVEEKSITLYSEVTGQLFLKNQERKENEYFSGECDNAEEKIRDIKSSWEYETFPIREREIPSKIYGWQLDVYMDLWDFKESELIYCLVDTPYKLISDELRRMDWKYNIFNSEGNVRNDSIDLVVETVCNLIFTEKGLEEFCEQSESVRLEWFIGVFKEIPEEIRIKVFSHNYCTKRNQQLKTMAKLARDYMNSLIEQLGEGILKFQNTA